MIRSYSHSLLDQRNFKEILLLSWSFASLRRQQNGSSIQFPFIEHVIYERLWFISFLLPGSLIKPEERMAYTYNLFPYSQRTIFSGRKFFIDLLFGCVSTKLACHVTSKTLSSWHPLFSTYCQQTSNGNTKKDEFKMNNSI